MKLKKLSIALLACGLTLSLTACNNDNDNDDQNTTTQTISLLEQGTYKTDIFDESAAEIVAYDADTEQTFVVNADSGQVDVIDSSDVTNPVLVQSLDIAADTGEAVGAANSVAVKNGLIAIAVEAATKTDNGWVVFYNTNDLSYNTKVPAGALPDMLTFTPDGSKVIVANEGEPNEGYTIDPEGSVTVVTVDGFTANQISFSGLTTANLPENFIINGAFDPSVAQDMEPEYIAVSDDSQTAYVALQENNALVEIDLTNNLITDIKALGFKDHSTEGNGLDGNNKDGEALIKTEPALGIYMPDAIAYAKIDNVDYILTANEGDDRADWIESFDQTTCEANGFYFHLEDAECLDDMTMKDALDSDVYAPADANTKLDFSNFADGGPLEDAVRRLKFSHSITAQFGDTDNDGKIDKMLSFGARSFTIWNAETGEMVFDSADDFEQITKAKYGNDFNQSNDENAAEDRSDNKGPEPEAVVVGKINDNTYAFIGLERMGGIMVYDISNPADAQFVEYVNNRDITVDQTTLEAGGAGDLGPEGLAFVAAEDSPSGKPLLIVGNEVSGTTTFYNIEVQ